LELICCMNVRRWITLFGYLLFIGMMVTGYYYNLTFVQFGLLDLGTRLIGLSEQRVALHMAALALLTCAIALGFGFLMQRRGWGREFRLKLRLAFGVVSIQTILTGLAPFIRNEWLLLLWIVVASGTLGVGVPVTFGLTVDLIPTRHRGYVAAAITAAAYFAAAALSSAWQIEAYAAQMLWLMLAGTAGLGLLAFGPFTFIDALAQQHQQPEFRYGRLVRQRGTERAPADARLFILIGLMFGVYFVDSLGFLRLADTPIYFDTAWQSPELEPRLFIGGVHVLGAFIGGVLYSAIGVRRLLLWIFGIFALVHLMYTFDIRVESDASAPLVMPMLYALTVSLYTVVNFALWADLSTPDIICLNSALGVALSGWTATFLSTALAMYWTTTGMLLEEHLRLVDALAMLFFLTLLILTFAPRTSARRWAEGAGR